MSELKYWLWLSSLVWLAPRKKLILLRELGGAREVFFAPEEKLKGLGFLTGRELEMLGGKSLDRAQRIAGDCEKKGIGIVTLRDAAYPKRLAGIYDPPPVLYVRGRLPAVDECAAVAVVGTRSATPYGLKTARRLGYELGCCGGLVVSGLTQGIDAAAARGALLSGRGCIGVLGTPIDDDSWGGGLNEDVAHAGALVSEYPPGAERHSSFFRARNRISSGLSVAVLVVEAPAQSGALLFAGEAESQGREIFAVPGNIDSPSSEGTNRLLMERAQPAMSGWDLLSGFAHLFPELHDPGRRLRELPPETAEEPAAQPPEKPREKRRRRGKAAAGTPQEKEKGVDKAGGEDYIDLSKLTEGLEGERRAVALAIDGPSVHIDEIVERTALPVHTVLRELTMLQLDGVVEKCGDKTFRMIYNTQK